MKVGRTQPEMGISQEPGTPIPGFPDLPLMAESGGTEVEPARGGFVVPKEKEPRVAPRLLSW
jgi:hypothetical protein